MSLAARSVVPAAFSLSPSWSWSGNDGSWSTFDVAIGTPPQSFHVLPSTTGSETWVVIPEGCEGILINIPNCGILRGTEDFEGETSRGFETNASSTWDLLGIYELSTEQNLWGTDGNEAYYGLDTVTLERLSSGQNAKLQSQTVAGTATANVWLGSLGLGTAVGKFDVHKGTIPSLMQSLQAQNYTPSMSFGYTAGASYSSPQDYGSLIIGGYDKARFQPSNFNLSIQGTDHKTLPLMIASIIADNTIDGGTKSLLPGGNSITTIIDSTVSQMWLPQNVCDLFAEAFGLQYDTGTGLYLINSTTHRQLQQSNPIVTFAVGDAKTSGSISNIELPYSAFDLQAGIPIFNATTNYFPLRVAANESQQVLGRVFLQEAYIFVDWEREYFTVGQVIHQNTSSDIVNVLSLAYEPGGDSSLEGLSTGAIAGLAIGACVLIGGLIALAAFFIVRSRRRRLARKNSEESMPMELHSEHVKPPEIMSEQVYEMQEGETSKHELYAKPLSELHADTPRSELDGNSETFGWDKKPTTYYEMP